MVRNVERKGYGLRYVLGGKRIRYALITRSAASCNPGGSGELFGVHHAGANLDDAHVMFRLLQAERLGQAASAKLCGVIPRRRPRTPCSAAVEVRFRIVP